MDSEKQRGSLTGKESGAEKAQGDNV